APNLRSCSLRFAVRDVFPALGAELAQLQPLGTLRPLVPCRRVIAVLALGAGQCDQLSGHVASAPNSRPYSRISVTRPAPTVRPPSRMANRIVFSMAMG